MSIDTDFESVRCIDRNYMTIYIYLYLSISIYIYLYLYIHLSIYI